MGEALRAARRRSASRAAELLEQQARFRGVVEHLSEGVALTGPDGRVVYANGTMAELLGLGGAPLEGREWAALMPDAPACGEETVWWEADHARGDGRQWLVGRVQPFRNADGERVGTMHVLRDVTARRVAEEALRRSEEMLRQSQKMEAVGRVAGGVAHDFNNILAAVRLSASLLRMDVPPDGEAQESLAEIEEAVERASALVRQLMAFSRRQVLQPKPVDLNRVVEGMRRMLHRLVPSGVEVVARVADEPAVVMADAVQLEQVLLNLCVNARDAMPHGGRLAVSVLRAGDEGPPGPEERAGWWLAVEDTGVGMDAATLQRVFEPFFTTRGSGGGTGLGLATVYGIVHQSGGELRVESVPGEGTVFHVFLPAPTPGAEAAEAETADPPAGSVAG
jgi:PAS domain S-box-containing protein